MVGINVLLLKDVKINEYFVEIWVIGNEMIVIRVVY